jgi:chorismate mutase/prephenate dehydratase
MEKINNIRKKINVIDKKILQLLNERAKETVEIGKLKNSSGKAVYVPSREADILNSLYKTNNGPLSREQVNNIFKEIISSCRSWNQNKNIIYRTAGNFSHQAAVKKFGLSAEYIRARL